MVYENWRIIMRAMVLALVIVGGAFCSSNVHASDVCKSQTGIHASLVVRGVAGKTVKFLPSIENVGEEDVPLNRDIVPWFNPGRFSFVLLDSEVGSALVDQVSRSHLKFDGEGAGHSHFSSKIIHDAITAYGKKIVRGRSFSTAIEFSVESGGFANSKDLARIVNGSSIFLWSMQVRAKGVACTQYGLSSVSTR